MWLKILDEEHVCNYRVQYGQSETLNKVCIQIDKWDCERERWQRQVWTHGENLEHAKKVALNNLGDMFKADLMKTIEAHRSEGRRFIGE